MRAHHRVVALLAYLVLEPEAHSRDKLANLLWADAEPDAADTATEGEGSSDESKESDS